MQKIFGAKRKERRKVFSLESDKKWWQFLKKSKIEPTRAIDIQHHVNFDEFNESPIQPYYDIEHFINGNSNVYG
jgi:hypothetical protein